MKYIKTKEGRIAAIPNKSKLVLYDNEKLVIDTTKKGRTCVYGIVEKIADTIEELCDEFVVIDKKWNQKYVCFYTGDEYFFLTIEHDGDSKSISKKELLEEGKYDVYGAIWTDKGLIYAAKMNESGVLELL